MHLAWILYILKDPRGAVRYVGWTSQAPAVRLRQHLAEARTGARYHRATWIRSLLAADLAPTIHVIERGRGDGWAARERYWIARFRSIGADLVNGTDGGEGMVGYKHGYASRAKMRATRARPDVKAKMSAAVRAGLDTPQERRRRSALNKGSGNPGAVLREQDVIAIRAVYDAAQGRRGIQKEIALRFGVTQPTICNIVHRSTWRHV